MGPLRKGTGHLIQHHEGQNGKTWRNGRVAPYGAHISIGYTFPRGCRTRARLFHPSGVVASQTRIP
jgi:hypothetical protein